MTIHAFCRRLLATHPLAAGLDPRFRVLDAAEAARLRDRAVNEALDGLLAADDADVAAAAASFEPWRLTAMTLGAHERLRSQGMADPRLPQVGDPAHSPKRDEEQRDLTPDEVAAAISSRAALERILERFDSRYEELKDQRSALDFQDLELRALELLRSSPAIAEAWRGRFAHVMVDEFQDTNSVQLELVEQLRGPETRVFMVGDENQSIYRFRNADLEVFREQRRRARESADSEVLPLRGNFRSLPPCSPRSTRSARRCSTSFTPLTAGREAEAAPGDRADADARQERGRSGAEVGCRGDRPRSGAERLAAGESSPRPGAWRADCAISSMPARPNAARSSSCCAPSPMSTPMSRRSRAPACGRSSSAVAATGPSSRSRI